MLNIAPLPGYVYQPVLPAVFNDSVSYLEIVSSVAANVDELAKIVNSYDGVNAAYVDQKVRELKEQVETQMRTLQGNVEKELNETTIEVMTALTATLATMDSKLNLYLSQANAHTDTKYYTLKQMIEDISIYTVYVYNPVRGYTTSVSDAIEDIYNTARYNALTAVEYDGLNLTALEYDNKLMSAGDYDFSAKIILSVFVNRVVSPVTGKLVTFQDAIDHLADFHKTNAVTAREYDNYLFTAKVYDDKQITAYAYDFNGKNALTA